jgi:phosphoglucosamine mutase
MFRIGAALVRSIGSGHGLRFVVGRDTRESGEWIERELARGVRSEQAQMTTAGVIPTPAIAYVTRAIGFDAGFVISASHNPFHDNGIKIFSGRGEKFTRSGAADRGDRRRHVLAGERIGGRSRRLHERHRRVYRARAPVLS